MSDNRDDFFGSVFRQDDFSRQLAYENRVVKRVIGECGIKPRSWGKLVNLCRDNTGQPFFSFDWFNQFFSGFPALLCGKRIGYCGTRVDANGRQRVSLYQLTLRDVLRPEKNLLVRAVSNALADMSVDTNNQFVFVFPLVKKMFCAHNLDWLDRGESEIHVQWSFTHQRSKLIVEPTESVFRALGNDWYEE
jgi:hypothetical protein